MRIAIMNRKIAKERKKKQDAEDAEAQRSRERVKVMNNAMAKMFRRMIAKEMSVKKTADYVNQEDKLRARLAAWKR